MEPVKKVKMMYGVNLYALSVDELVSLIHGECQVTDSLKILVESLKTRVLDLQQKVVEASGRKFLVEDEGKKITNLHQSITKDDVLEVLELTRKGFRNYQRKALAVLAQQIGKVNMVKWQDMECMDFKALCMKEAIKLMKEDL